MLERNLRCSATNLVGLLGLLAFRLQPEDWSFSSPARSTVAVSHALHAEILTIIKSEETSNEGERHERYCDQANRIPPAPARYQAGIKTILVFLAIMAIGLSYAAYSIYDIASLERQ
jgi:hypothetical protein